jgi:glutathione S-transferase
MSARCDWLKQSRRVQALEITAMAIRMYDLAGEELARRFSPFCWRSRMALAHKGLTVETIPWRFTEKGAIAHSGQERVPVIEDGGRVLADSWAIANYLEEAYPGRPSLFGGPAGHAMSRFFNSWADTVQIPGIASFVAADILRHLDPCDRDYFRQTREKRFGMSLDDFCASREMRVSGFRQSLEPLRQTLQAQPFFGGETPLYPDYTVFGGFQWARAISPFALLENADPIAKWRERMLDAFDGLARNSPAY